MLSGGHVQPHGGLLGWPRNWHRAAVSFQWKNPDFLLKNPDFLLKNEDFTINSKRADAEVQDLSCWSPMTNIMRHPLRGRGHEGYGEDPFLAGEMVFQNVLGVQGFGLDGYPKHSLANTGCKHFSTFNGPLNWGTAVISDYDWFLNYMPQFERCLDAGSFSVMCSYSNLNGVSGCADRRAMQTVL